MATKEAVFSLKVDTGNSVNDIKSFDQAVNSLNKDVNTLQSTVAEGAGTDVFADKLTELNAKVEAGGLSMREMTKTMKEYQNIAAAAGMSSPVGQAAIAAAGELKDGIGDIKSQVNALSSDTVKLDTAMGALQGGAAVFQGISSAIALTGVENEELMQTMVKLQAVQGVMNSINEVAVLLNEEHVVGMQLRAFYEKAYALAVGTSTGAMKLFRLALVATGIGALIVGLGLLIANWDKVTSAVGKAVSWFNKLGTGVKIVIGIFMPFIGVIMLAVKGLQMLGLVEDDEDKKRAATHAKRMQRIQKQMEKERELRAAQKQAFDNQQKQFDREIALAEALGQSTVKLRQQKIQASIDVQKEQIKEYENGILALNLLFKNNSFMSKMNKEKTADAKENLNKMNQDVLDQENEKKIIQINANKDAQSEAKDHAKKLADIEKARLDNIAEQQRQLDDEIMKALNDFEDSKQTARQLEENKINEYYFNLITQARINKKSQDDIAALEAAQTAALRKNTDKFNKEDQVKYEDSLKKKQTALRMYQGYVLDEYQLALVDFDNAQKEEVKTLEDNLAAKLISQDMYFAALEAMKIARDKKVIELDKKKAADERDANIKKFEEDTKALSEGLAAAAQGLDLAGQMNSAINEIQDAKLAAMQKETDAQLSELEIRKNAELDNANLTAEQKQAINDKYALIAYNLEKKQFDAAEKLRKQQFIREKALKIASIAISTAEAVMKAIATGGGIPTGIPFGVATGVVGAAQLAAVMSTKYEGGTAPSMPDVGASSSVGASASALGGAGTTNAQTTSLADFLPGGSNGPPISQVVVLESDITGTQQKVQTQQSLSTY
jgi:hypothetical protein